MNLLAGYSSSGSDSDADASADGKDGAQEPPLSRPPPLPAAFVAAFSSGRHVRPLAAEDRSVHQGRVRSFAHVDGVYPVHVSVPVRVAGASAARLGALVGPDAVAMPAAEWHVSLSRPFGLRRHMHGPLRSAVEKACKGFAPFHAAFAPAQAEVLVNDERTRAFLAVPATGPGRSALERLLQAIDEEAVVPHGGPAYYEAPRIHFSLAWALVADQRAPDLASMAADQDSLRSAAAVTCWIDAVDVKIGVRTTSSLLQVV